MLKKRSREDFLKYLRDQTDEMLALMTALKTTQADADKKDQAVLKAFMIKGGLEHLIEGLI